MALFKKLPRTKAPEEAAPTLVMREIYADAMPEGITGNLQALKDQLIAAEKVHPFVGRDQQEKYAQLDRCRLDEKNSSGVYDKHCYGLFEQATGKLRTVVYVNLAIAAKEAGGTVKDSDLPGNIHDTLNGAKALVDGPDTAIFYSISSMNVGKDKPRMTPDAEQRAALNPKEKKKAAALLAKAITKVAKKAPQWHMAVREGDPLTPAQLSDGELLIRSVAEHLQNQHNIKAFSTLSPMRSGIDPDKVTGFATWLKSQLSGEDVKILTASEQAFLQAAAQGANYFERISSLHKNYATLQGETKKTFEMLMEDLGTHYIAYARNKTKSDRPLDPVTGFHIGNGAKLANIHYLPSAQTTLLDNAGSFGMMVNYRYEPEILSKRKHIARSEDTVPLTPTVTKRYTARLEQLGMSFKLGKRSPYPATPVIGGQSTKVGNTLYVPAASLGLPKVSSWEDFLAARAGDGTRGR